MQRYRISDLSPGIKVTGRPGWETGPKNPPPNIWPRYHLGTDLVSTGTIVCPIEGTATQWIPRDGQGNSVLRIMTRDEEVRMYHFKAVELGKEVQAAIQSGRGLHKGTPIAIPGNVGAVAGLGGGRVLHMLHIVRKAVYDEELTERFGDLWRGNVIDEEMARFGEPYAMQIQKHRIERANEILIERHDPFWGRQIYALNIANVFGE
jgi:hypothetical protein